MCVAYQFHKNASYLKRIAYVNCAAVTAQQCCLVVTLSFYCLRWLQWRFDQMHHLFRFSACILCHWFFVCFNWPTHVTVCACHAELKGYLLTYLLKCARRILCPCEDVTVVDRMRSTKLCMTTSTELGRASLITRSVMRNKNFDESSDFCIPSLFSVYCPFNPAHCCHMGTAIKHPVQDRVKPSIVCNFWYPALWPSDALSPERQSARMSQITNDGMI